MSSMIVNTISMLMEYHSKQGDGISRHLIQFHMYANWYPHLHWWQRVDVFALGNIFIALQWRLDVLDSVSNHQLHDCLLKLLFRRRSKKTSKLRVTGLCVGNSPAPERGKCFHLMTSTWDSIDSNTFGCCLVVAVVVVTSPTTSKIAFKQI